MTCGADALVAVHTGLAHAPVPRGLLRVRGLLRPRRGLRLRRRVRPGRRTRTARSPTAPAAPSPTGGAPWATAEAAAAAEAAAITTAAAGARRRPTGPGPVLAVGFNPDKHGACSGNAGVGVPVPPQDFPEVRPGSTKEKERAA